MSDDVICGKDEAERLDRCEVTLVDPARVRAVRERLASAEETEAISALFKVLSDPSRCRLVTAIIEAGELCVCDLAAAVEMSESNVSHHLRVLRGHGLVRARRDGSRQRQTVEQRVERQSERGADPGKLVRRFVG